MRENTLANLIKKTRERKKISKTMLSYGICSVTALSRYESGERIPDKYMADGDE